MKTTRVVLLFVLVSLVLSVDGASWKPEANPKAVHVIGNARFSILTPYLIRMEWSDTAEFNDLPTYRVVNRHYDNVPYWEILMEDGWLIIETNELKLRFLDDGSSFNENNLNIEFKLNEQQVLWQPGMMNSGNLLGTLRTLDGANGSVELNCTLQDDPDLYCTEAVISTDGWALDDSDGAVLEPHPEWVWWASRNATPDKYDWYFFGYGHNYKQAMRDFTHISGKIPLPPRYIFGVFFSRYWAYSDKDTRDLIKQYQSHNVPLDIIVTDMDWHITFYKEAAQGQVDQAGQTPGWTGYTWDSHLFPNPKGFLDYCKQLGLKNTLNLHPASGVQPHESLYPDMARAMGVDPATNIYVPFDIVNTTFTDNLLDIMLYPLQEQGIDLWWLDWQQYMYTNISTVNPTMWLNYVFFNNFLRQQDTTRPAILHRWGGLGNHRYQIGFSGDVIPSWPSLEFQVYFTATATNVGYSFWSHDIGGHTQPPPNAELYTRWIQWGVFSPAFRPHCTKQPDNDRRIWMYPESYFEIMRDMIVLRSQLVPYIYTLARITHDTGVGQIVKPMYYEYPEQEEAYTFQQQYFFGDDVVSAPVVSPLVNDSQLAEKDIWFPPGRWINFFTGEAVTGPTVYRGNFSLEEVPIYVRECGVIPYTPLRDKAQFGSAAQALSTLGLHVFPTGTCNTTSKSRIYDDNGDTAGYESDEFAWTTVEVTNNRGIHYVIDVHPAEGSYPGMKSSYSYEVQLHNVFPPDAVTVNSQTVPYEPFAQEQGITGWQYDGDHLTLIITVSEKMMRTSHTQISVIFPQKLSEATLGMAGKIARAQYVKVLFDYQWGTGIYQEDYPNVITAALTGQRIGDSPQTAISEINQFASLYQHAVTDVVNMGALSSSVKSTALSQLLNVQTADLPMIPMMKPASYPLTDEEVIAVAKYFMQV